MEMEAIGQRDIYREGDEQLRVGKCQSLNNADDMNKRKFPFSVQDDKLLASRVLSEMRNKPTNCWHQKFYPFEPAN